LLPAFSYEAIRLPEYSHSKLVQVMSWPGLMSKKLQQETSDDQIEVAIAAMNKVIEIKFSKKSGSPATEWRPKIYLWHQPSRRILMRHP